MLIKRMYYVGNRMLLSGSEVSQSVAAYTLARWLSSGCCLGADDVAACYRPLTGPTESAPSRSTPGQPAD